MNIKTPTDAQAEILEALSDGRIGHESAWARFDTSLLTLLEWEGWISDNGVSFGITLLGLTALRQWRENHGRVADR